jgi:superfamily I DNA and RNA helicase
MEKNIKKILEELYAIEPSLREKEEELTKIVKIMIQSKPNIEIDENFKNTLRNQILENIKVKKIQNYKSRNNTNFFHIFSYIF